MYQKQRKKFSLIELLVVLAIIAILASLLMPSLRRARATARGAECLNSIRSVSSGMQNFALDNDNMIIHSYGSTPNSDNWAVQDWAVQDWALGIDPYLGGQASLTLADARQFSSVSSEAFYACTSTSSASLNTSVFDIDYGVPSKAGAYEPSYTGQKYTYITKPSESLLLADTYNWSANYGSEARGRSSFRQGHNYDDITGMSADNFKHNKQSSTYSFMDGSARLISWLPEETFRELYLYDLYNSMQRTVKNPAVTYSE